MNKTIKIIVICAVVVLLTGTTVFAAVHFSNAQKEEETTESTTQTTTQAMQITTTTSTTEQTTNPAVFDKSVLLDYYWENDIVEHYIYEFNNDNTVTVFSGDLSKSKSYWNEIMKMKYLIKDNMLLLDWYHNDSYVVTLDYITKKENVKWDEEFKFYDSLSESEYFFYDTSFTKGDEGFENAVYLVKGVLKTDKENSDNEKQESIITEEEAIKIAKDYYVGHTGDSQPVMGVLQNQFEYIEIDETYYYLIAIKVKVEGHWTTLTEYYVSIDGKDIFENG